MLKHQKTGCQAKTEGQTTAENEMPNDNKKWDIKGQQNKGCQTTTENVMPKHNRKRDAKHNRKRHAKTAENRTPNHNRKRVAKPQKKTRFQTTEKMGYKTTTKKGLLNKNKKCDAKAQ